MDSFSEAVTVMKADRFPAGFKAQQVQSTS